MTARKFALDISWVFFSQIITLVIGFLLNVILGRFLAATSFGLFTMMFTIYTIASLVAGIGIPPAIVKYVAEFKENKEKLNIFVSCGVVNSVFFGVIIGLILFLFSSPLADIFNMPELADLIKIVAFALPFLSVNNTLLSSLNGLREMKSYSFLIIVRSVLLISFVILLIYMGLGVKGAALALLLAEVGALFLLVFLSRNLFSFITQDYLKTTRELVKFGSRLFLASAIYLVNTRVDMLLVGYFLTDKDVGIYAMAVAFTNVFFMVPVSVSKITYPMMSENYGKKLHQANEILMNKMMKYSLLILSILGILIIFFAQDIIIFLLGSEFLPVVIPLTILIIALIFFGPLSSTGSAFSAASRPDIAFKINLMRLVPNVALDVLLIPKLGITGAAIATAISMFIGGIIGIHLRYTILRVRMDVKLYLPVMSLLTAMIIIFFIFKNQINTYLLAGIMFVLYFVVVTKFLLGGKDKGGRELGKTIKDILR